MRTKLAAITRKYFRPEQMAQKKLLSLGQYAQRRRQEVQDQRQGEDVQRGQNYARDFMRTNNVFTNMVQQQEKRKTEEQKQWKQYLGSFYQRRNPVDIARQDPSAVMEPNQSILNQEQSLMQTMPEIYQPPERIITQQEQEMARLRDMIAEFQQREQERMQRIQELEQKEQERFERKALKAQQKRVEEELRAQQQDLQSIPEQREETIPVDFEHLSASQIFGKSAQPKPFDVATNITAISESYKRKLERENKAAQARAQEAERQLQLMKEKENAQIKEKYGKELAEFEAEFAPKVQAFENSLKEDKIRFYESLTNNKALETVAGLLDPDMNFENQAEVLYDYQDQMPEEDQEEFGLKIQDLIENLRVFNVKQQDQKDQFENNRTSFINEIKAKELYAEQELKKKAEQATIALQEKLEKERKLSEQKIAQEKALRENEESKKSYFLNVLEDMKRDKKIHTRNPDTEYPKVTSPRSRAIIQDFINERKALYTQQQLAQEQAEKEFLQRQQEQKAYQKQLADLEAIKNSETASAEEKLIAERNQFQLQLNEQKKQAEKAEQERKKAEEEKQKQIQMQSAIAAQKLGIDKEEPKNRTLQTIIKYYMKGIPESDGMRNFKKEPPQSQTEEILKKYYLKNLNPEEKEILDYANFLKDKTLAEVIQGITTESPEALKKAEILDKYYTGKLTPRRRSIAQSVIDKQEEARQQFNMLTGLLTGAKVNPQLPGGKLNDHPKESVGFYNAVQSNIESNPEVMLPKLNALQQYVKTKAPEKYPDPSKTITAVENYKKKLEERGRKPKPEDIENAMEKYRRDRSIDNVDYLLSFLRQASQVSNHPEERSIIYSSPDLGKRTIPYRRGEGILMRVLPQIRKEFQNKTEQNLKDAYGTFYKPRKKEYYHPEREYNYYYDDQQGFNFMIKRLEKDESLHPLTTPRLPPTLESLNRRTMSHAKEPEKYPDPSKTITAVENYKKKLEDDNAFRRKPRVKIKDAIEKYRRDRSEDNINYLKAATQTYKKSDIVNLTDIDGNFVGTTRGGGTNSLNYQSPDLGKRNLPVDPYLSPAYLDTIAGMADIRKLFQQETEKKLIEAYGKEILKQYPRKESGYFPAFKYGQFPDGISRPGGLDRAWKYFNEPVSKSGLLKTPRKPDPLEILEK